MRPHPSPSIPVLAFRPAIRGPSAAPARAPRAVAVRAEEELSWAIRAARVELACAPRCRCCPDLLGHLRLRVGSTLFLDDDPAQLALAFPTDERAAYSPRLLAACVLVHGRRRVSVFGAGATEADLPALRLLRPGPT